MLLFQIALKLIYLMKVKINLSVFYLLLLSIFLISCKNSGWKDSIKSDILRKCIDDGKSQVENLDDLEEICVCSLNKFISKFSFDEYNLIIKSGRSVDNSYNNIIQLLITEIMEDCNIKL